MIDTDIVSFATGVADKLKVEAAELDLKAKLSHHNELLEESYLTQATVLRKVATAIFQTITDECNRQMKG